MVDIMELMVSYKKTKKKIRIHLDQAYDRDYIYEVIRLAFDPKKNYDTLDVKIGQERIKHNSMLTDMVREAWSKGETTMDLSIELRNYGCCSERTKVTRIGKISVEIRITMTMNLLVKSDKVQKKIQIYLNTSEYRRYYIYNVIRLAFDPTDEFDYFRMKVKGKYVTYPESDDGDLTDIVWEAWSSGETTFDNIRVYTGSKKGPCDWIFNEENCNCLKIVGVMVIFVIYLLFFINSNPK